MTARMPRWPRTRALALGALATLALVGACEARMPTAAEIDALDVRRAEAVLPAGSQQVVYMIDGRVATPAEAHALAAESILQIDVSKGGPGSSEVAIITRAGAAAARDDSPPIVVPADTTPGARVMVRRLNGASARPESSPIILIDGVRADAAALQALRTDQIERVDVIKGAAARQLFNEPQADQGVIRVTTKAGHP